MCPQLAELGPAQVCANGAEAGGEAGLHLGAVGNLAAAFVRCLFERLHRWVLRR